ncbi:PAS domain S-box-containing protein [Malonomonas rubra DSM 5091]|uniref:histidine kinase n=1 Tax=Malonomonas rubra DSM 5091 TaxID=1122189 RepID=A0A1M6FPE6_MALRU|nr:PAS domain-containing sensor histidine kinase [Malonomonas rubra]SHI99479.1 PAS domain S-box-containing protein [Malonomonas rubra DSM 5091]
MKNKLPFQQAGDQRPDDRSSELAGLRQRAEQQLQKDASPPIVSETELRKTVHELQTYQIELELQNEELRNTRDELLASRKRLSDLYDYAPVGYLTVDDSDCVVEANLKIAQMLATDRASLLTTPLSRYISVKDQGIYTLCREKLLREKSTQRCEIRLHASGGVSFDAELHMKLSSELDQNSRQLLILVSDMTEIKEARRTIMESELKYRLLADYTYDWESWISPQGEYLYLSPSCERISGYAAENFRDNPQFLFDLVRQDHRERVSEHYRKSCVQGDAIASIEFPIVTKNGEECWLEHHCSPVFDDQGNFAGRRINNRDITERKQMEQQHAELENQLRQKMKMDAVGSLAGGMAHNFNNNLSVILGNIELAALKQPIGSESHQYLENVKIAALSARDLVKNLLIFSRQGAGKEQVKTICLADVVSETVSILQATVPCSVNLSLEIHPASLSSCIKGDPSQMQEVLLNLCTNAVQAMDERGELVISLEGAELAERDIPALCKCKPGHYLKLSVEDTGCGIADDHLDMIFDPFFTTKDVGQGTGLGLSTVKGIIEQHGGILDVTSEEGQGSRFVMYFPEASFKDALSNEGESVALLGGTERVLLVDDDRMLIEVGNKMLKEMGYQVTTVTDSREALKTFAADPDGFDLVITDQTMPEMTGTDLIEEIRKIRSSMAAILCTGYSSKVDAAKAKKMGINAFLMKPIEGRVLLDTVRLVLDSG